MLEVVRHIAGGHKLEPLGRVELGGLLQEGRLECCLVDAQRAERAEHVPNQHAVHCVAAPLRLYLLQQPHHRSPLHLYGQIDIRESLYAAPTLGSC